MSVLAGCFLGERVDRKRAKAQIRICAIVTIPGDDVYKATIVPRQQNFAMGF